MASPTWDSIFSEWAGAGLLPEVRKQRDEIEGPGRQRRRFAKYDKFYTDYHVYPLPLSEALRVYQENPRAPLSVPLIQLKPDLSPIESVNAYVEALKSSNSTDLSDITALSPTHHGHTDSMQLNRSLSNEELPIVNEPVIAIEAINTEKARDLNDTVDETADEESSDTDEDDSSEASIISQPEPMVETSSVPSEPTVKSIAPPPIRRSKSSGVESGTKTPPAVVKQTSMFGKLFGKFGKETPTVQTSSPSSPPITGLSSPKESNLSAKFSDSLAQISKALSPINSSRSPQRENRSLTPNESDDQDDDQVGEYQRFFHLLAPGDEFLPKSMFACWRSMGLDKHPAVLLLATHHMYIIDNFTLDSDGKIVAISESESLAGPQSFKVSLRVRPPSQGAWEDQDPDAEVPIPRTENGEVDQSKLDVVLHVSKVKKDSEESAALSKLIDYELSQRKDESFACSIRNTMKLRYTDLTAMHRRRYQLRQVGIELFSSTGQAPLLSFATHADRERVYTMLATHANSAIKQQASQQEAANSKRNGEVDPRDAPQPRQPLRTDDSNRTHLREMTEKWQNGLISNFDYLIFLNTLAGRSFSDLTQYPVFPWVLTDYKSETLDLNDPRIYRDLSKPMGAIGPERAKMFAERYACWDDTAQVGHRYHYATHYSSPASVLYYLIRVQPFTKTALQLQGGRFDHADRLFHDVARTFESASSTGGAADVKECIPEFYYLPDMFMNTDRFDFGEKQRGGYVDHVDLPPWANNDPRIFVSKHRQALESPHVSANLHHWIDLIFGFKQRGTAAVQAQNVFHYLTYQGVVDIDKISDPLTRAATIDQMNQFGQTPRQIFKIAHPPRRVQRTHAVDMAIHRHPQLLIRSPTQPNMRAIPSLPSIPGAISSIHYLSSSERLVALDGAKVLIPNHWSKFLSWGHIDSSLRVQAMPQPQAKKASFSGAKLADSSVLSCLIPHTGAITCTCVSEDGRYVITGSLDMCVSVHSPHPIYEYAVLEDVHCIVGHDAPITALACNSAWKIVVSGASNGSVILFDLDRMEIKRRLPIHPSAITAIAIHHFTGDFVTCAGSSMFIWDVNGELVAEKRVGSNESDSIEAIAFTQDSTTDYCVITGGRDSVLRVRALEKAPDEKQDFQSVLLPLNARKNDHVHRWPMLSSVLKCVLDAEGAGITTIHCSISDVGRMWCGDSNGKITAFSLSNDEHWQKDEDANGCALCAQSFTAINRRHHCRKCGQIVCNKCSGRMMPLPDYGHVKPVRVCNQCYVPTVTHHITKDGKLVKNKI